MTPTILINADDYGMHPDINAGIRYCLENSLINTVAVSVCGESLDDFAVSSLKDLLERTSAQAGVHLMLTEGRPLTGLSSLTQKDGSFLLYINDFVRRYLHGAIKFSDIEQEWDAQIRRLTDFGIKPAFLNGHQHIHLLPGLWRIAVKLAARHQIPRIRTCYQSVFDSFSYSPRHVVFQIFALIRYFCSKFPRVHTVGTLYSCNFILERIQRFVERAARNKTPLEVTTHPGFETPSLLQRFGYWNAHWKQEIFELTKLNIFIKGITGDPAINVRVTARYENTKPVVHWFVKTRATLCPFPFIESLMNNAGSLLDVGCGVGYLAFYSAESKKDRICVGIDTDQRAIKIAQSITGSSPNPVFYNASLQNFADSCTTKFDVITIIDVLYQLSHPQQEALLKTAASLLTENGGLIIKETHRHTGIRYLAAYLEECFIVTIKRRRPSFSFYYRSKDEWQALLKDLGMKNQAVFKTPYEKLNNYSCIFCCSR